MRDAWEEPENDGNELKLERELALREVEQDLEEFKQIKQSLNKNRPLEALATVNGAIYRLQTELDEIKSLRKPKSNGNGTSHPSN